MTADFWKTWVILSYSQSDKLHILYSAQPDVTAVGMCIRYIFIWSCLQ